MLICAFASLSLADETDPHSGVSDLQLTTDPMLLSVTVPTTIIFSIEADGWVIAPDNVKIINNSHGAVKVSNIAVRNQNGWEGLDYWDMEPTQLKVDAKQYSLYINGNSMTGDETIKITNPFTTIKGANENDNSDELKLNYDAKFAPQSQSMAATSFAQVIYTIAWDTDTRQAPQSLTTDDYTLYKYDDYGHPGIALLLLKKSEGNTSHYKYDTSSMSMPYREEFLTDGGEPVYGGYLWFCSNDTTIEEAKSHIVETTSFQNLYSRTDENTIYDVTQDGRLNSGDWGAIADTLGIRKTVADFDATWKILYLFRSDVDGDYQITMEDPQAVANAWKNQW